MTDFTITSITRVHSPKPNRVGHTILAWFDVAFPGCTLRGCAFVRAARGGLNVWAPKIEEDRNVRRSITITDEHLRKAMVKAAQVAYRAVGGTDGEFPDAEEREII